MNISQLTSWFKPLESQFHSLQNTPFFNETISALAKSYEGSELQNVVNLAKEKLTSIPSTPTETVSLNITNTTTPIIETLSTKKLFDTTFTETGFFIGAASVLHIALSYFNVTRANRATSSCIAGTTLAFIFNQDIHLGFGLGALTGLIHHYGMEEHPFYSERINQIRDLYKNGALGLGRFTLGSIIGTSVWKATPNLSTNPIIDASIKGLITLITLSATENLFQGIFNVEPHLGDNR